MLQPGNIIKLKNQFRIESRETFILDASASISIINHYFRDILLCVSRCKMGNEKHTFEGKQPGWEH